MSSTTTSCRPLAGGGEPGDPVVRHLHRVALGGEPAPHHLRERHLVLHQQYAHVPTVAGRLLRQAPAPYPDAVASARDERDGGDVAGWDDLVSYVRVRYEVMRQAEGELWFNLPTTGDRTQLVVVRRVVGTDGEPWAQIASPICKVATRELDELLRLACGVGRRRARRRRRG